MALFAYEPAASVPFRDREAIARCRAIPRSRIEEHANPEFRIRVVPDGDLRLRWMADIYARIQEAREAGRPCVLLLPNPIPGYRMLAHWINRTRLSCKHVWFFAMDEYADHDGRVAPLDWPRGFGYALLRFLWGEIDEDLRPPREQVHVPGNDNLDHFGELMEDAGGLDASYTGPGWTGHLAFVEPDAPEFTPGSKDTDAALQEWKQMGTRIVTLSPFTLAQNSLHGSMGFSGDLAAVPPKAATVGPKEVIAARYRWEMAGVGIGGTASSWQRLIARLCYHGPVTPRLPSSIHQTLRTDCFLSETIAADIHDTWERGY
jgi:6-phosphogluconolactonase/glucosamine-6-phosphate isomerase/deaminase